MAQFRMPDDEGRFWDFVSGVLQVKGKRILDIGAGEEASSTNSMIKAGGAVTILDNNEERLKKQKIPGILGDASNIPLSDGSYDLVTAFYTLHEIPADLHEKTIREMRRVGKKIAFLESFDPPANEEERKLYELIDQMASSVGEVEKPMSLDYWLSLLKETGIEAESQNFEFVHRAEEKTEEDLRESIKASSESRGYPKDLLEAYAKQAVKVAKLKGKLPKHLFLIAST